MLSRRVAWTSVLLALSCTFPDITIEPGATTAASTGGGGAVASSATAGTGGDPCAVPDKDGDLVDNVSCGGQDCNDDDARAKPGQTSYFDTPMDGQATAGGPYDFDCSGSEEMDPTTRFNGCNAVTCTGEGFDWDQSSCGTNNGWVRCRLLMGMLCEPENELTEQLQKCH